VADGDVTFLDALRILRRNIQEKINFAGDLSARFPGKRDEICSASASGLHSANDVRAIAARRERHKNVVSCNERFNLPGKDSFESVVISRRGQHRGICSERQSRQARAFRSQPYHQFRGKMQCVRGTAAIPKKNDLAACAQSGCRFLRELRDSTDQFIGKTLFYASAFLELAANFFGRRGHCNLAEYDFFAMAHDAARGVARIYDQLCGISNRCIVIAGMVGGNNHGIVAP